MLRCSGWMLGHILTSRIRLRSHWLLLLWLFHLCIPITASSALNHRSTTGVFRHVKHRGHFSGKLSCHLVSRRCLHRQMHPVQCQCFTATRYTAYDTVMYYIMFGTCRLSGKKMFTFFNKGLFAIIGTACATTLEAGALFAYTCRKTVNNIVLL